MQSLVKIINSEITKFIKRVSSKYDLDEDELLELWSGDKTTSGTVSNSDEGCPYVGLRGEKKGQVCGAKPKDGSTYCSVHKKYEGKESKTKKSVPVPKTDSKRVFLKKPSKIAGYLLHETTGFLIKEGEEKVSKKLVKGKAVDLSEEDYEDCDKYGFPVNRLEKVEVDSEDEEPEKKVEKEDKKKGKKQETKPDLDKTEDTIADLQNEEPDNVESKNIKSKVSKALGLESDSSDDE